MLVATAERSFCQRACARFTITSISGDFYAETTFITTSSLENFDPLGMGFREVSYIAGRLMSDEVPFFVGYSPSIILVHDY